MWIVITDQGWTLEHNAAWDEREARRKADDPERCRNAYLPPSARQCGIGDHQQWLDLCA